MVRWETSSLICLATPERFPMLTDNFVTEFVIFPKSLQLRKQQGPDFQRLSVQIAGLCFKFKILFFYPFMFRYFVKDCKTGQVCSCTLSYFHIPRISRTKWLLVIGRNVFSRYTNAILFFFYTSSIPLYTPVKF